MLGLRRSPGTSCAPWTRLDEDRSGQGPRPAHGGGRLPAEAAGEILDFIGITAPNAQVQEKLSAYRGKNELFDQGLAELNAVTEKSGRLRRAGG
jgi:histidyl-tRNA synthetase